jgi:hypothetical protein
MLWWPLNTNAPELSKPPNSSPGYRRVSIVRDGERALGASHPFYAMPPISQFKRFDVRELIRGGVEPFPEIRKRVDTLETGQGLLVIAPFLPSPLIEKLSSEGYATKVERGVGAGWMVYFWREA